MDREYCFEWVVNGSNSRLITPGFIRIKNPLWSEENPDLFPHTVIYDNGTIYHNEEMLVETVVDGTVTYNRGSFDIEFTPDLSSGIDVYRSLDKIFLNFLSGNTGADDGDLTDYIYNNNDRILTVVFKLPFLDSGEYAYYKLILKGGEDGIVDNEENYMGDDIEIYVIYTTGL